LRLSILAAVVVCAIVTSATGSRGPIVSIIVAVATVAFLTLRSRDVHAKSLVIMMAVLGTAIGLALHLNPSGFSRVLDGGDSGRSGIYSFTLTEAVSNPDGIGWGGFATVAWRWGSDGDRIYPHNILLELLVEGGVIAFLGFALVFTFAVWRGTRSYLLSKDRVECVALGVYLYALTNAQFSSDLVGNRMLWVSLGLGLALSNRSISREKMHP
jgi:O-antigen ligase